MYIRWIDGREGLFYRLSKGDDFRNKQPTSRQTSLFHWATLSHKVGQTDLVLVCNQGSLVGLCMRDYKSLWTVATIWQTDAPAVFWRAYRNSSASCARKWNTRSTIRTTCMEMDSDVMWLSHQGSIDNRW